MDSIPTAELHTGTQKTPGFYRRIFDRIFTRHAMHIALLSILPMALADTLGARLSLLGDPDIWWHLANARILCATHHFIHIEPYSFSVAGAPWINPEWLSELPFWFSYHVFGLRGIYLAAWLAVFANLLLLYWRGYLRARNSEAALWAAALGFILTTVNCGPRMIVVAYLALSVEMLVLELAERGRARLLWLLPPLFCVWINLHGSWLIGFALLILYVLCGLFRIQMGALEQEAFPAAQRNRLIGVLILSALCLWVNPYGWRLIWNPFDMMLHQQLNLANVAEWKPLRLDTLLGEAVVLIIALMVLANLKVSRKWKLYEIVVVLFAGYAAFDHVRFTFLAAVLITPTLAADFGRSFSPATGQKTLPAMNALIATAALCFLAFMFPAEAKLQARLAQAFPLQTIRSLQPQWRTFDLDYVGGMMAFESKPSLIDSRVDTFEHHGVFADYLGAMYGIEPLEVLNKYRIDHVLVEESQPLSYLLKHTPGWTVLQREKAPEGQYILFAKTADVPAQGPVCPPTH